MMDKISTKQAVLLSVVLALVLAPVARAGVGDIITLLNSIASTITNHIGVPLNDIQKIQTAEHTLQQDVLFPLAVIKQSKAFVSQVRSQFSSLAQQIHNLPANSATLANPQQLESLLRGGKSGNLGQMSGMFFNVFQPLPGVKLASPQTRNLMDVDDAFATAALKSTVISDQATGQMLNMADSMEEQIADSAPGSAPMLSAQALTANIQSQAFLQRMLAAELREEAGRLAHSNMVLKQSSVTTQNLTNGIQRLLNK